MKSFLVGTCGGVASAGAANYNPFVCNGNNNWSNAINSGFEQPLPHAITLDRLRVKVDQGPGAGKNLVFTVYKNGVSTALTCTISGTGTTAQDLTHSVSFAAGDLITIQMTPDATATLPNNVFWTGRQDASGLSAVLGTLNTTGTGWSAIQGFEVTTLANGDAGIIVPCAGTISNLYVIASASGAIWTVYKNGTAQTLTTGTMAGTTANDTTHSFSVAAGDRISIRNTGTGRASSWGVSFAPTTDGQSFIGQISNGNTPTSATQYYQPQGIGTGSWNSTESAVQLMLQACTVTAIYAETSVSPGVAPKQYTFTLDVNNSASAAAVVVQDSSSTGNDGNGRENSTTGLSVTINDDDLIDFSVAPSGTPIGLHAYNSILITVSSGGTLYTSSLSGSLGVAGSLTKQTLYPVSGSTSLSGSLTRKIFRSLTGSLGLAGSLTKLTFYILAGAALGVVGSLTKRSNVPVSGSLALSGNIPSRQISRPLSGSSSLQGSLQKKTSHNMSGSTGLAGTLNKTTNRSLSGSTGLAGTLTSALLKLFSVSGSLGLAGSLTKRTSRNLSGNTNLSGNLNRSIFRTLTGSLNVAGSLFKRILRTLSGSTALSGALNRLTKRTLTGSTNASGSLNKRTARTLAGSEGLQGNLSRQSQRSFSGSTALSGSITRRIFRLFTGSSNLQGNVTKSTSRTLNGSLQQSGNLSKGAQKTFSGQTALSGSLTKTTLKALAGSLSFSGSLIVQVIQQIIRTLRVFPRQKENVVRLDQRPNTRYETEHDDTIHLS